MTDEYSSFVGVVDFCTCGMPVAQVCECGEAIICCPVCDFEVRTPLEKPLQSRCIKNVTEWNKAIRRQKRRKAS